MDTARNGAGKLVKHANRQGPWLAPGQRSLAGPGIRDFLIRHFVNSDSTSDVERRWSASCVAQAASERGSMGAVHRIDRYYVQRRVVICILNPRRLRAEGVCAFGLVIELYRMYNNANKYKKAGE